MSHKKCTHIAIISYRGAQLASVYGLKDLFTVASMAHEQVCDTPHHVLKADIYNEDHPPTLSPNAQNVIIIPPSMEGIPSGQEHLELLQSLKDWHQEEVIITSICAGTFILAAAGLLDGHEATTHWVYADTLKERFPSITVCVDRLLIDNETIITSGGLMAWVDLGLHIVERILGTATMIKTAHFMLVKPPRQQQSPYIDFQRRFNHSDTAILKSQRWLDGESLPSVTVSDFARASGLSTRTFLRRFKKAVGTTPKDYLLQQIIAFSRQSFETTSKSVTQVAWEAGYSEVGSFRRAFKRITGLSPASYRRGE